MMGHARTATRQVAIVEDHGLIAHSLAAVISSSEVEVHIVVPEGPNLLELITRPDPDLVLLDLDLGQAGDATPLIGQLVERGARVLMVTGVQDPVRQARCIAAGASGVVSKWGSFDDLIAAIEVLLAGDHLLTEHDRQEHLAVLRHHDREERLRLAPFERLSRREAQVLGELMAGRTVPEIAETCFLSVTTIRSHVRAILSKVGVSSQVVAVARAHAAGWLPPEERLPDS